MNLAHACYRQLLPGLALFLLSFAGCAQGAVRAGIAGQEPAPAPDGEAPAKAGSAVRWPLDLPARWLTSNFMEHRGGRYHAGLDFKTREQEGFPAYAVEDGFVERVRATAGGYGRALYLRGDSGRLYVYAHLARFADAVEHLVAAEQSRAGRYGVELEPAAGALRVARGEAVGVTGQSGTTGPHLHFEVRDAAGRPLDPLAAGFAVRDTIPPVIHHVRALAASPGARLAGGGSGALLAVAGRTGAPAGALRVSGPVAFSARVVEATDPAGHRLEPWRLLLLVDGAEVLRRENESFDFADNSWQRLEWLETGALREQWLHGSAVCPVPGRGGGPWYLGPDGRGLAPGLHHLELQAEDRAGNRSVTTWEMEVLEETVDPGPPAVGWEPVDVQVEVAVGPSIGGDVNTQSRLVLAPLFDVLPEAVPAGVLRLQPETTPGLLAPLTLARVSPGTLNAPQAAAAARQGLVARGRLVDWQAAAWPVSGSVVVDLPEDALAEASVGGDPGTPGTAIYRWDGDGWRPAGEVLAPLAPGSPARFALPRPGLHAALADTLPPVVEGAPRRTGPHPGWQVAAAGLTPPRWRPVAVGIVEAGSGVDPAALEARWDGQPLVVEPDLLRDRVLVHVPDTAGPGAHRLELQVADFAGHGASVTIAVECAGE